MTETATETAGDVYGAFTKRGLAFLRTTESAGSAEEFARSFHIRFGRPLAGAAAASAVCTFLAIRYARADGDAAPARERDAGEGLRAETSVLRRVSTLNPGRGCTRCDRDRAVTAFRPHVCYVINVLAGRTTRAVVAALLFPLLLLTACSDAAAPAAPPVTLGFCGTSPQVRPDVVLVDCNTDAITARNLTWSGWGKATATAEGSATIDLCAYEDCASGDFVSVPIEMIASKIMHCAKNTLAYSTLRYVFPHGSPFKGVSTANAPGYLGAQSQPVPPAHQTVSLTC
jgi:hypothetical protein